MAYSENWKATFTPKVERVDNKTYVVCGGQLWEVVCEGEAQGVHTQEG